MTARLELVGAQRHVTPSLWARLRRWLKPRDPCMNPRCDDRAEVGILLFGKVVGRACWPCATGTHEERK